MPPERMRLEQAGPRRAPCAHAAKKTAVRRVLPTPRRCRDRERATPGSPAPSRRRLRSGLVLAVVADPLSSTEHLLLAFSNASALYDLDRSPETPRARRSRRRHGVERSGPLREMPQRAERVDSAGLGASGNVPMSVVLVRPPARVRPRELDNASALSNLDLSSDGHLSGTVGTRRRGSERRRAGSRTSPRSRRARRARRARRRTRRRPPTPSTSETRARTRRQDRRRS